MPRASAADAARTAHRVLGSATSLFAARGFADVSLDDVARSAEVTRGAVYHHYRNKAALFTAVAARLQAEIAAAVAAAAENAGPDPSDQLRAGSHAFLDTITSGAAVQVLLIDAPAVIGWREWRRLDEENSEAHLREALHDAGVTDDLLGATTAQLSGAMNELALWVASQDAVEHARARAHTSLDRMLSAYLS
ncbi:MAG: TetR family transcriptional regulator [Microbacterium enclense]